MSILIFALYHYSLALVFFITAALIGNWLTKTMVFYSGLEKLAVVITLGLGIVSHVIFLLGYLKLLYPQALLAFAIIAWIASFSNARNSIRGFSWGINETGSILMMFAGIILFSAVLSSMALPLYPPTHWDAIQYHLPYAKAYSSHHQILQTPYIRFPVFPQANEMLFTAALLLGDDIVAHLIQFFMMLVLVAAVLAFSSRYFSLRAGLCTASLLLGNPILLCFAGTALIDVGLTLFSTMAVYSFWNWKDSKSSRWLILTGLFAGFAAGSKYTGLFFIGILVIGCISESIQKRRHSYMFVFAAAALFAAGPWYLRNYFYTRNPFFPFFPEIFGTSFWSEQDIAGLLDKLRETTGIGRSIHAFMQLPWQLTFHQEEFHMQAPISKIYFFLLPLILAASAFRNSGIRGLILISFAYVIFWFFSAQELRYLLPVLPFVSLCAGGSADRVLNRILPGLSGQWSRLITVALMIVFIFPGICHSFQQLRTLGAPPATLEQREAFLSKHLPSYPAYRILNERNGDHYAVYALFDENMMYFADGLFLGDWFGNWRFSKIARHLNSAKTLHENLKRMGVDYFLVATDRFPVVLTEDEEFKSRFTLIYSNHTVKVFELAKRGNQRIFR